MIMLLLLQRSFAERWLPLPFLNACVTSYKYVTLSGVLQLHYLLPTSEKGAAHFCLKAFVTMCNNNRQQRNNNQPCRRLRPIYSPTHSGGCWSCTHIWLRIMNYDCRRNITCRLRELRQPHHLIHNLQWASLSGAAVVANSNINCSHRHDGDHFDLEALYLQSDE